MIRGLIFDINGTLTNIWTNEGEENVFRTVANFLTYQGVLTDAETLRRLYTEINKRQRGDSKQEYPEFDAVALFAEIIESRASAYTKALPATKRKLLPSVTAEVFRAASLYSLRLYDGVADTLSALKRKYQMAAVSDGQKVWAVPELYAVGLGDFFNPLIVSGEEGYRKPDARLFQKALKAMRLRTDEVVFVGNDLYRDVYGANMVGMKSVFFRSNQGNHDFENANPDYVIDSFSQLPDALRFFDKW